jgi:cell division protein FtsN
MSNFLPSLAIFAGILLLLMWVFRGRRRYNPRGYYEDNSWGDYDTRTNNPYQPPYQQHNQFPPSPWGYPQYGPYGAPYGPNPYERDPYRRPEGFVTPGEMTFTVIVAMLIAVGFFTMISRDADPNASGNKGEVTKTMPPKKEEVVSPTPTPPVGQDEETGEDGTTSASPSPNPSPSVDAVPTQYDNNNTLNSIFVNQLGAYDSLEHAQKKKRRFAHLQPKIVQLVRDENEYYRVVFGRYESKTEANNGNNGERTIPLLLETQGYYLIER